MDPLDDLPAGELPNSLEQVREMIGLPATLKLLEYFGGIRVFIPRTLYPGHHLIDKLGEEAAQVLTHCFGGETLAIPRAHRTLRRLRNLRIAEDYDRGIPVRELARLHHLTERQLYAILANYLRPPSDATTPGDSSN